MPLADGVRWRLKTPKISIAMPCGPQVQAVAEAPGSKSRWSSLSRDLKVLEKPVEDPAEAPSQAAAVLHSLAPRQVPRMLPSTQTNRWTS